jgi:hypothetical protein
MARRKAIETPAPARLLDEAQIKGHNLIFGLLEGGDLDSQN